MRRGCALLLAAVAWLAGAGTALAQPVYGVWRGTLGRQEVMVNLQPEGCGSAYYYLRHLWSIVLTEKSARRDRWHEGPEDAPAVWTLEAVSDGAIEGTWSDAAGQRRLPLRLKRVAAAGSEKPNECSGTGYEAFNAPRVKAKAPVAIEARIEGRPWKSLEVPGTEIRALLVPAAAPSVPPRLERRQRRWVDQTLVDYFECQLGVSEVTQGKQTVPEYRAEWAPVHWNGRWLTLRENHTDFCAGAHPNFGVLSTLVWDLAADREVDPWSWLAVGKTPYGGRDLPPKLKTLLAKIYAKGRDGNDDSDRQCREAVDELAGYKLAPSAEGMVFLPDLPHVVWACADDIVVPWAQLGPFLTPAGKAAQAGLAAPPSGQQR